MADDFNKILNNWEEAKKAGKTIEEFGKEVGLTAKELEGFKKYLEKASDELDSFSGKAIKAAGAVDKFGGGLLNAHKNLLAGNFAQEIGKFSSSLGALVDYAVKTEDQLAKTTGSLRAMAGAMGDITFSGEKLGKSFEGLMTTRDRAVALQKSFTAFGRVATVSLAETTKGIKIFTDEGVPMMNAMSGITSKSKEASDQMVGFRGALAIARTTGLDVNDVIGDMANYFKTLGIPLKDSTKAFASMMIAADKFQISIKQLKPILAGMTKDLELFGVSGSTLAKLPQMLGEFANVAKNLGLGKQIGLDLAKAALSGLSKMDLGQRAFFGGAGGGRGGLGGVFQFEQQMATDPQAMLRSSMQQIGGLIGGRLIGSREAAQGGAGVQAQAIAQRQMVGQQFGVGTDEARRIVEIMSQVQEGTLGSKEASDKIKDLAKSEKDIAKDSFTVQEKMLAVQEDMFANLAKSGDTKAVVDKLMDITAGVTDLLTSNKFHLQAVRNAILVAGGIGIAGKIGGVLKGLFGKGIPGGGAAKNLLGSLGRSGLGRGISGGLGAGVADVGFNIYDEYSKMGGGFSLGKVEKAASRTFAGEKGKRNIFGSVGAGIGGATGAILGSGVGSVALGAAGAYGGRKLGQLIYKWQASQAELAELAADESKGILEDLQGLKGELQKGLATEEEKNELKVKIREKHKELLEQDAERVQRLKLALNEDKDSISIKEQLKEAQLEELSHRKEIAQSAGELSFAQLEELKFKELKLKYGKDFTDKELKSQAKSEAMSALGQKAVEKEVGGKIFSSKKEEAKADYAREALKNETDKNSERAKHLRSIIESTQKQDDNEKKKAEISAPKSEISEDVAQRRARLRAALGLKGPSIASRTAGAVRIMAKRTEEAVAAAAGEVETTMAAAPEATISAITPGDHVFNITLQMDGKKLSEIMRTYSVASTKGTPKRA